jgi:hypothetical protein
MKAERRHQLQENSLVHALSAAPLVLRKYGTHLLTGLLVVVLAVILLRKRAESARETQVQVSQGLTSARGEVDQIPVDLVRINPDKPDALVNLIRSRDRAERFLDYVLENATNPAVLAEARLTRGDLNWQLATLPPLAAAATQPGLKLEKSGDQFLQDAAKSYEEVARDDKAHIASKLTAKLSLAAVAETRRKWDEAKAQYLSVLEDASAPEAFKAQARQRLTLLDVIRIQPFTGAAPSAVEGPAFTFPGKPATTQATSAPATATAPSATAPATKPAAGALR